MASLIVVNTAIDIVNFCMAFADAVKKTTSLNTATVRSRSLSTDSVQSAGSVSSKMGCDSGYGSGDDEGQDQEHDRDKRPPDRAQHAEESDIRIHISRDNLLYAVIAVLVIYMIDPELLVLPLVALCSYIVIQTALKPSTDLESFFNLSAFCIDWESKPKVQHEQITKVVYVEKPIHYYYHKIETKPATCDTATQTVSEPKPKYVDQASSTVAATNYTTSSVQTDTIVAVKPKYADQETSTDIVSFRSIGTQTSGNILSVTTTREQDAGMRLSAIMRNRVRRKPIHASDREVTPIKDNIVAEINRDHAPYLTIVEINTADLLKLQQNPVYLELPPPAPHCPATAPGYDPHYYASPIMIDPTGTRMVDNYYRWAETSVKGVFVSGTFYGQWLIRTPKASWYCVWSPQNQIWFCPEYGYGFYENEPEENAQFQVVYGDITQPDPNMIGPARTGSCPKGPYWQAAITDAEHVWDRQKGEENERAAKFAAQMRETLAAQQEQADREAQKAKAKLRREQDEAKMKGKQPMSQAEQDKIQAEEMQKMKESRQWANEKRARAAKGGRR
ncbi:hypothetical protein FB567DRAFT_604819 [Paraphoma chrysanthemicola]|uniref:Uncharacterized protein n=1 Tax=Paraphoma chrysanthemicola TaxID=798071 RepID=A0A8K0VXE9_9PLEO|nr:hypothetical protein FB567DRAFT_604819 [Paraphoma chrysanthemicola]